MARLHGIPHPRAPASDDETNARYPGIHGGIAPAARSPSQGRENRFRTRGLFCSSLLSPSDTSASRDYSVIRQAQEMSARLHSRARADKSDSQAKLVLRLELAKRVN